MRWDWKFRVGPGLLSRVELEDVAAGIACLRDPHARAHHSATKTTVTAPSINLDVYSRGMQLPTPASSLAKPCWILAPSVIVSPGDDVVPGLDPVERYELYAVAPLVLYCFLKPRLAQVSVVTHDNLHLWS